MEAGESHDDFIYTPRLSLSSLSGNGSKDGTIDNLARCIVLHFLTSCLGTVYTIAIAESHDNTADATVIKYSIVYCNDGHLIMNSRYCIYRGESERFAPGGPWRVKTKKGRPQ
jgi:hypothetical protein